MASFLLEKSGPGALQLLTLAPGKGYQSPWRAIFSRMGSIESCTPASVVLAAFSWRTTLRFRSGIFPAQEVRRRAREGVARLASPAHFNQIVTTPDVPPAQHEIRPLMIGKVREADRIDDKNDRQSSALRSRTELPARGVDDRKGDENREKKRESLRRRAN